MADEDRKVEPVSGVTLLSTPDRRVIANAAGHILNNNSDNFKIYFDTEMDKLLDAEEMERE